MGERRLQFASPKFSAVNDDAPVDTLDALAQHCIAARSLIDRLGSDQMRCLIDLLLFEVGAQIASESHED